MVKRVALMSLLMAALGCELGGELPRAIASDGLVGACVTIGPVAQGASSAPMPRRPQTPVGPYPYEQREVLLDNRTDDSKIGGTLTLPAGAGPHPAALLISGSGSQDRDETIHGHKPFLVIADQLTRAGFAVLRVDDRGVGSSTGDADRATIQLHATDVRASLRWLRQRPEVDAERVGLIGHSEGGIIAPMVAAQVGAVAFIVSLAAPGVPGHELSPMQVESVLEAHAVFPGEAVRELVAAQRKIVGVINRDGDEAAIRAAVLEGLAVGNKYAPEQDQLTRQQLVAKAAIGSKAVALPWFRSFIKTDPRVYWKQVRCPVLALNGDKDTQVQAAANLRAIGRALAIAGNGDVSLEQLPGLNHLFQPARTGLVDEYDSIDETFDPAVLHLITRWMSERFVQR